MKSGLYMFLKSKVSLFLLFALMLLFIVYTALLLGSVHNLVADYNAAKMVFDFSAFRPTPSFSALYFWYGTCAPYRLPTELFSFFETVFSLIFIPLFLSMLFVDSFAIDYDSRVLELIFIRRGKNLYVAYKSAISFLGSFVTIYVFLLFQFIIAYSATRLFDIGFIAPEVRLQEILIVLFISLKISLFYACISLLSFSISLLFKRRIAVAYIAPVLICLTMAILIYPSPFNMSFYYPNLMHDDQSIFWISMLVMIIVSISLQFYASRERNII